MNGRHRVEVGALPAARAIADPGQLFAEANDANNATWVDLRFTGSGVRVVAYGPAA